MKVILTSGNWVEVVDPTTLTNGQRKLIIKANDWHRPDGTPSDDMILTDHVNAVWIRGWSFPFPIPTDVDPSPLDDLQIKDYDELTAHVLRLIKLAFPDFGPDVDPKAPTESLTDSGTLSAVDALIHETLPNWQPDGENINL